jgi:L-aminopeptidase/D-esterase-like protein
VVPIVPAAVVFDLAPLGRFDARPTAEMAYEAAGHASPTGIAEGSVGAGAGATVGKALGPARAMKGGVGCHVERAEGLAVGALAVVNALGDVRDADGRIIAGARGADGAFADLARTLARGAAGGADFAELAGQSTTLAVVATSAALTRVELGALARAASAALYRRVTPAGTPFDGDIVFACCPVDGPEAPPLQLEALAARALEHAIERAVRLAKGRDGIPGLADAKGSA